jgi:hypothetical protein
LINFATPFYPIANDIAKFIPFNEKINPFLI